MITLNLKYLFKCTCARASLVDQEDQVIDQRVKFSIFCRFFNMVDDISEARDISGRSEGPTANLTESKTDENLW